MGGGTQGRPKDDPLSYPSERSKSLAAAQPQPLSARHRQERDSGKGAETWRLGKLRNEWMALLCFMYSCCCSGSNIDSRPLPPVPTVRGPSQLHDHCLNYVLLWIARRPPQASPHMQ